MAVHLEQERAILRFCINKVAFHKMYFVFQTHKILIIHNTGADIKKLMFIGPCNIAIVDE